MKGLGPSAPEGFSVPTAWHVCGTWVQSPSISSCGVLWHLCVQEGHGGLGTGRVVWLLFFHPQLRSYPCTESCWRALAEGWPSCNGPSGSSEISPAEGEEEQGDVPTALLPALALLLSTHRAAETAEHSFCAEKRRFWAWFSHMR